MKWTRGDREGIDDQRASSGGGMRVGAPLGIGGLLVLLVLSWATGVDFLSLLGNNGGAPPSANVGTSGTAPTTPQEEEMVDFVAAVMKDAQDTWRQLLGGQYQETRTTLFRNGVQSGCGFAQSASGPFYCPADHLVYLDLSFFEELKQRFRAPGDFAQAYVLAHELGHHVQSLLGTETEVRRLQQANPSRQNELSVRLELQADCYAGVWGNHASKSGRAVAGKVELEEGDAEEALNAASAIGDDRIQRQTSGRVVPDSFTHGSSEQRVSWFKRGFQTGDPNQCNTFQRGT
jgi:predicted metalloprotease